MKISYITTYNARDIHNWSGAGYYIAKALRDQDNEIDFTGDLTLKFKKMLKAKELVYRAFGYRYQQGRELFVSKHYADQIEKKIDPSSDILFSPGTIPIAYLNSTKPKVFYTDATFAGMLGFYKAFSNLSPGTIKNGNEIEQAALSSCSLAIYSSDWAARSAMENYEVAPEKVKVVPFGANIQCDRNYDDINEMIKNRSRTICRLLFLGVDWERKGGDAAVNIMRTLNSAGLRTELHIAGIKSFPFSSMPENMIDHGFISKATQEGREKIERLIAESHFLLHPAKAECYGLVLCEANSFGVPAIATHVGGIPTVIKNDVNGRLFPLSSTSAEYADYILNLFNNYSQYEELALSSFSEYQNRLNWGVAGKRIMDLIKNL